MNFESGHLFHIYNQGNNRQKIFFERENYLFFLRKIRTYILPYADVLAYCLMPNHFHLMVFVRETHLPTVGVTRPSQSIASHPNSSNSGKLRSFNDSIAVMLRSYTRAINNRFGRSGALFREETKAICITLPNIDKNVFSKKGIFSFPFYSEERQYPNTCFNYILKNPVNDGMVKRPEQWEFSSATEMIDKRQDSIINVNKIQEFGLFLSDDESQ